MNWDGLCNIVIKYKVMLIRFVNIVNGLWVYFINN